MTTQATADLYTAIVTEMTDDALRLAVRDFMTPGATVRDGKGNLRDLTDDEKTFGTVAVAEFKARFAGLLN